MHTLNTLRDRARPLLVKSQIGLNGVSSDGVEVVGAEVAGAIELQHDLNMILQVVADR